MIRKKNSTLTQLWIREIREGIDTVQVEGRMVFRGTICREFRASCPADQIRTNGGFFEFDTTAFGRWSATVSMLRDHEVVFSYEEELIVTSPIYHMAYLQGSLPTLLFILKMMDGTANRTEDGDPAPSIVAAVRRDSLDWDKLPENIYACPLADRGETASTYEQFCDYARELCRLNPLSKFVFYFTDCYMYGEVPQFLWVNNPIPEESCTVKLLTDGGLSYYYFQSAYGNRRDANAMHQAMVGYLKTVKQRAAVSGVIDASDEVLGMGSLAFYIYAMLDVVEGSEWWLVRKGTDGMLAIQDTGFLQTVMEDARVREFSIENLLKTAQEQGKEETLRALFRFHDEALHVAEGGGEKMLILGTTKNVEEKSPLENYVEILKKLYGDHCAFYYKGHPSHLPELIPERKKALEAMGLTVLDSQLVAEVLLFYHPELRLSGYPTSLFLNAGGEETDAALFRSSKEEAERNCDTAFYARKMKFFISELRGEDRKKYRYYIRWRLRNRNCAGYLIEQNGSNKMAIYDVQTERFRYFRRGIDFTVKRSVIYFALAAVAILLVILCALLIV